MIHNNPYHAPPWPTQRTLYDQALQKTFPIKRHEMLPKNHNAVNVFYDHLSVLDKDLRENYMHMRKHRAASQNNTHHGLAKHMMQKKHPGLGGMPAPGSTRIYGCAAPVAGSCNETSSLTNRDVTIGNPADVGEDYDCAVYSDDKGETWRSCGGSGCGSGTLCST
tara:strand:+ start:2399 stop:2893 length:495 start_codon:yes stop_codon:yes gene_type:complete